MNKHDVKTADNANALNDSPTVIELYMGPQGPVPAPKKNEGYAIKFDEANGQNRIILSGHDKAGLNWAWQTFRKLLKKTKDETPVSACDIEDWPDYPYRGLITYNPDALKENLRWKVNFNITPWWAQYRKNLIHPYKVEFFVIWKINSLSPTKFSGADFGEVGILFSTLLSVFLHSLAFQATKPLPWIALCPVPFE